MTLNLPPRHDGTREAVNASHRRVIIIGANGSGKTRFTERLLGELSGRSFRLSALNALYKTRDYDPLPGSIDSLYSEAATRSALMRDDLPTQFERLMTLLVVDEMLDLLACKMSGQPMQGAVAAKEGRLDKVINAWQEMFPGNNVLYESGKMLFSRMSSGDAYSPVKLSDGEKAVLYCFGAAMYAPEGAAVFVDNPGLFLHPSITGAIWDRVESMRPDCTFIYTTHDFEFLSSRSDNIVVWVRDYDASTVTWDYVVLPPGSQLTDDLYMTLVGARKPVLFIEGDATHSIDAKLYPLVFTDYTVRSLGSCNKVIEATRTFNDLNAFHHLDSHGIVDRDRRDPKEVRYLRDKKIFVPEVAEIENILMLEDVVKTVAGACGKNESRVFDSVKRSVMGQFKQDIRQQAMLHTRHRVKRFVECRIDGRFANVAQLEQHMSGLVDEIKPRKLYQDFCNDFHRYVATDDYPSVLRVYNQKSMLPGSNVAGLCGLANKEAYINKVIKILRGGGRGAERIRRAIIGCFGLGGDEASVHHDLNVISDDLD